MSQEALKRKSADRSIKRSNSSSPLQNTFHDAPSGSNRDNQQFHTSHSTQQFRSDINEAGLYRSEDRKQEYQNNSQSFNEQRQLYAEQAINAKKEEQSATDMTVQNVSTGYDYQAVIYMTEDSRGQNEFKRYISDSYSGVSRDGVATSDSGKEFGNSASIFDESDKNLTNAISYLDKNNEEFNKKLDKINQETIKAQAKINRIERSGLEYRNSYKPWKYRLIFDKKNNQSEIEAWHSGRGSFERIHVTQNKKLVGRLKFQNEKIAYTDKKHGKHMRKESGKADRNRYRLKQAGKRISKNASGSEFEEDELIEAMKKRGKNLSGSLSWSVRTNIRKISKELDGNNRLKFQNVRIAALNAKTERLNYKSGIDLQKRKADEAAKQGLLREQNKRKVKKQMVQEYKREQGNIFQRSKRQHQLKKTVKKEQKMAKKRVKALVSSGIAIVTVIALVFFSIALFSMVLLSTGSEAYVNGTSQNDYHTMTEATAYFREKEAELEEKLKPENIEPLILEENPDIFEFIYVLDDISFDANTLIAYLSAKYNEFNLEMVKGDLDELFEEYYTLTIEIEMEEREVEDTSQMPDPVTGLYPKVNKIVPICYVILEKKDFFELCKSRIDDAGKQNQMDAFYLTGNGQQIYGPVMAEDWRKKISSNFGWRIHPITGVKIFHDGVDIAIPIGTALYSPVNGTVVKSVYSNSAGNMITIENDSGWLITFMHMDSRTVQAGESIKQGQRIGYSGNTGNSTGPHLHLQIHDADGNSVNPVFIVPFSTIEESETF